MLTLDRISKTYRSGVFGGTDLRAVRGVSFDVHPGEVVSLIGESGSGKTTIGKMVLRLVSITGGAITVDGMDVRSVKRKDLRAYYRNVQGVFQDPFSSCNPIFKVDHVFGLIRDELLPGTSDAAWRSKLGHSLEAVGLDPSVVLPKYPHQLSGGQLQRLLIARALLLEIRYLVADEIISMLDASTRIDVLNLLGDLKSRGMGILFITHDLSLGNYISERTVILRRGRVVEMGATEKVFGYPLHPYTRMLVASVPQVHRTWADVEADLGGATALTGTCPYHERYPNADGRERPLLVETEEDHLVACFELGTCDGEFADHPQRA